MIHNTLNLINKKGIPLPRSIFQNRVLVAQQTRTRDQTFEGVVDTGPRPPIGARFATMAIFDPF